MIKSQLLNETLLTSTRRISLPVQNKFSLLFFSLQALTVDDKSPHYLCILFHQNSQIHRVGMSYFAVINFAKKINERLTEMVNSSVQSMVVLAGTILLSLTIVSC